MKKQLYLDIKNNLKTIQDENGKQLFKHFDLWNQQVDFLEQETPFDFPAVFVEFMPHKWKTLGNRVQDTDLIVRFHIVTKWYAGTADYSPTEHQALEYLDIVDKVVAVMHGFTATGTNSFMRTQTIPNHNHERYVDNIEEYVCNLRDISAVSKNTIYLEITPIVSKDRPVEVIDTPIPDESDVLED